MNLSLKIIIRSFLILITLIILVFYVFARGVVINILPIEASENAIVTIKKGFGFQTSNRFIFFPGNKTLSIESPGFYTQDHVISVESSSNTHTVKLLKLPGRVKFNMDPIIDVDIYIDGKLSKPHSNVYSIDPGRKQIEIRNPLYLTLNTEIEVIGMDIDQIFSFKLIPNWAPVFIDSSPTGAQVFLENDYLGATPLKINIPSGLNKFVLKKEGYQDFITIERIQIGNAKSIGPIKLNLLPGIISIKSFPDEAKVMVNNEFTGFTPLDITLTPNKNHIVSLELDGYIGDQKTFNIPSNSNSSFQFKLEKEFGRVLIQSNVPADIHLDKSFLAKTPYDGNLHAVTHNINITRKNYRNFSTTIKPTNEFDTKISATLITEEEARLKESPDKYVTNGQNTMVLLQPGLVVMGAKRSSIGQRANETIRRVKLTKPFYLSAHEVTNSQYALFANKKLIIKDEGKDNHPVVNISWDEAALYCNWLSKKEGLGNFYHVLNGKVIGFNLNSEGYRLPTESEWSWAARAGSINNLYLTFPWGDSMPVPKGAGNFADESSNGTVLSYIPNYIDGYSSSAPVGSFASNEKGIYDLGGNVSEYVNDYYTIMIDSNVTYFDLIGPKKGRGHVIKGSNWKSASVTELRYAYRDQLTSGNDTTGFRIARWLVGKDNEN